MDEIDRRNNELKQKEKFFNFLSQVMKEHLSKHKWYKLPIKQRLRIYNKPNPRGTAKQTNSLIPVLLPPKEKEDRLYCEVLRLVANILREEIERRRKQRKSNVI